MFGFNENVDIDFGPAAERTGSLMGNFPSGVASLRSKRRMRPDDVPQSKWVESSGEWQTKVMDAPASREERGRKAEKGRDGLGEARE